MRFLEGSNHVAVIGRSKGRARPDGKIHDTEWVQICVLDSNSKSAAGLALRIAPHDWTSREAPRDDAIF